MLSGLQQHHSTAQQQAAHSTAARPALSDSTCMHTSWIECYQQYLSHLFMAPAHVAGTTCSIHCMQAPAVMFSTLLAALQAVLRCSSRCSSCQGRPCFKADLVLAYGLLITLHAMLCLVVQVWWC
jgi:hypothetical protein